MLKKTILILVILTFVFAGAVQADDHVLTIGATAVPHSEILNFIKADMAEAGVELEIVEFNDYITPNIALDDGSLDANFFQHINYLEQFNEDRGLDLVSAIKVHSEPMGFYSDKYSNIEEIPEGASIAVPNDPTNEGRALILLHNNGVITLDDPTNTKATPIDIAENPKNLSFEELEAAQLPRVLPDVAGAVINTNYAWDADLNPVEDALFMESKDSPYVNVVAVRKGDQDNEKIKILKEIIQSEKVREFILEEYEGAVVPAFEADDGSGVEADVEKTSKIY